MTRLAPWLVIGGLVSFGYGGLGLPTAVSLAVLLAGSGGLVVSARRGRLPDGRAWAPAIGAGLGVILLTGIESRPHFVFEPAGPRATWPWFLLAGGVTGAWVRRSPARAPWLLLLAQLFLVASFFDFTEGAIPTRDDHPSFLYRLHILGETFPRLVVYNPEWNDGYLATEIVSTGALSSFLLGAPLIAAFGVVAAHAALVPWLFVGILPWVFFGAARLLGAGAPAATIGGFLALIPTSAMFLYSLRYGVYPFLVGAGFAVAAAAVFHTLFVEERGGPGRAVLLVAVTSFCLFWPLGGLMLFPVLAAFIVRARRLSRRGWLLAVGVGVALVALHLPWVTTLATRGDSLAFAASRASPLFTEGVAWARLVETGRRLVEELHPLSFVMLPLAVSLPVRGRWLLVALAGWNLVLALVGMQVREEIALERFSVPFAFFAALLATLAFEATGAARSDRVTGTVLWSVLWMGVVAAAGFYRNEGVYRYTVLPNDLGAVLETARERCPRDQRLLVPGFSLHWFGGGHVAALPLLTGRSSIANDFYHRRDYSDVVPPSYRSPDRLPEFLDLHDVGCVLTWNEPWERTLEEVANASRIAAAEGVALFSVERVGDRFYRGTGRVKETLGELVVETADEDVVIRYRWVPGLRSEPDVPLEPFRADDGTPFIRVRPEGHPGVTIRY